MRLSELTDGIHRGIISPIQVHIFHNRCANPADWTYVRIRETYGIKRDETIRYAFRWTSCGLFWDRGTGGGRDPHLFPLDRPTFRDHILARETELNCITRRDAPILAFDLALQRRRIAVILLEVACLKLPPEFLNITLPSPEWLNGIAGEPELRICAPQEFEAARHYFCQYEAISFFFFHFQSVIEGRNPRLIVNSDETQLSARKRFRVLTDASHLPLIKAETKLHRLTGLCMISARGAVFKPIIILK
jgi:hypothetical protein